ncbi:amidohydrolase [Granulicoccus sp. GXG6511]|uniref:amidohydrolase n=1 Tax=Granulicoccus sp. GXG6511 TaxID=3381351 RepID=UPI003D7CA477
MSTYYRHDKIFQGRDETSWLTAFAVEAGVITWVGRAEDIPADADVRDLGGAVVLPGLIDAHTHPTYIALTVDAVACTVPEVHSIDEMVAALQAHPNHGKDRNTWIEGWGYDESKLAEGRTPTRHDLDQVSTTQPVFVLRSCCHSAICNTRALEIAGITAETPDPPNARFGREPDGTPNGVLTEHAANLAVSKAKGSAGFDAEAAALARTTSHLAARGIVAVTDMFCRPGEYTQLDQYRAAAEKGFRQHTRIYYHFDKLLEDGLTDFAESDLTGRVAIGGIKLFMDGSMSDRTAWMCDPYPDSTETGMRTVSQETMAAALDFARRNNVQIAFHAMGDRAISEVVDFYADEEPWLEDYPSVRIEHGSVTSPELHDRMRNARMHFGLASNVDFFFAEYDSYSVNLTPDQFRRTYMVRDLYASIEALALTSDAPATTWSDPDNPFMSIQAAVTRKAYNGADIVPEQAVSVPQAILLYTSRAAKLADFGNTGQIAPGFDANFITLSDDIFTIDPTTIIDTRVTGTWIRGDRVHTLENTAADKE